MDPSITKTYIIIISFPPIKNPITSSTIKTIPRIRKIFLDLFK